MTQECKCKVFKTCFEFQHEQRPIVICSDSNAKTKYIYDNTSNDYLAKYYVDNGLITDNIAKCDFLLLNCDKRKSYFIEIKGSDIIRAIEQINNSIELLNDKLRGFSIFARIVLTRTNTTALRNTKYLRLQKKLEKLKGNLSHQSRQLREKN